MSRSKWAWLVVSLATPCLVRAEWFEDTDFGATLLKEEASAVAFQRDGISQPRFFGIGIP